MEKVTILTPVSIGELYDKISILQIKSERITDELKLENVNKELILLTDIAETIPIDDALKKDLYDINSKIWWVEDKIRENEKIQLFDETFINLARNVYIFNDKRAAKKYQINLYYGSDVVEEKFYKEY